MVAIIPTNGPIHDGRNFHAKAAKNGTITME
jgi:hypothetical protein